MESKINVTVRIKPLSETERAQEKNHIWSQLSENTIANVKTKEMFAFDMVFGEKSTTQEIFDYQAKELVNTAMQGINVTVFAYGQTSSGKTYTMRGYDKKDPGLIPLSIRQVFDYINQDKQRSYQVAVSYLEIYNESLNDLIEPTNKNLEIRESISKGIYINRLAECQVKTQEEVLKYMWQGDESRIIAETKLNEQSSRSHTVFRINITSKQLDDESKIRMSQLNLVDLAGSEGASKTQADGLRLREGSNINRSLLALSNVINRLSSANGGGKTFINFRDSKLTRILQTALGGNSKTAIICTMTQTLSNYQETVNTLHFGQKAKHVKTTVNVNEISSGNFNGQSGPEMEKAQKEITELKAKLKDYETKMVDFQQTMHLASADQEMVDTSSSCGTKRTSISGSNGKDSDFTVQFLKDQLQFVNDRLKMATSELEEKEGVIQKLEHEKREFQRSNENLEIENIKLAEKLRDALPRDLDTSSVRGGSHRSKKGGLDNSASYRTPNVNKQQNKRILEEDGIRCFDLERQSLLLGGDNEDFDLRQSLGFTRINTTFPSQRHSISGPNKMQQPVQMMQQQVTALDVDDQLFMITELEKLKKENEDMQEYIDKMECSRQSYKEQTENNYAIKEELELLKEESLFQGEELSKYQRHCNSLADELEFYKAQNNDLLRRLDDCERTLLSSSENDNNSSIFNLLLINNHRETQKLLKEENATLRVTIQRLKEEVKQQEMERSKSDSSRAEIEYINRAAEYNVEILKNQIENLSNENGLIKMQNDKQKKSVEIMRATNERMAQDLEHYKKLSLNQQQRKQQQPKNQQGITPQKPLNQGLTPSAAKVQEQPFEQVNHFSIPQNDCVQEVVHQDEISKELAIYSDSQIQVSILDPQQILIKDEEIVYLQTEVEDKQRKIDELEQQVLALQQQTKVSQATNESEQVKTLKFDLQILLRKLSEYKKAEKNAKEIVNDYEQMKLKYFNVLTEISGQKTQIQELIQAKIDTEVEIKELNEQKTQYINEMYMLRIDITKKIDELTKKTLQVTNLQEEVTHITKKLQELIKKENDTSGMQNDIDSFIGFFASVDKHMKTLVKLLREFISRCEDPKLIEHNQKQIKSIEGLLEDVKMTIKSGQYQQVEPAANRLLESFFMLSNDSLRDIHTSAMTTANNEADSITITQMAAQHSVNRLELMMDITNGKKTAKRRKLDDDDEVEIIEMKSMRGGQHNYDSADEKGTISEKKLLKTVSGTVGKSQKKLMDKMQFTSTAKKAIATPRRSDRKVL